MVYVVVEVIRRCSYVQWVGVMVSCVLCTVHALLIMGFHGQQATIDFTIYLVF